MPLGKNVSQNIRELYKDNKKSGKARGANGKPRGRKQIIAIAMDAAGKSNQTTRQGYNQAMKRLKGRNKNK
jgi:type IV secretory pathway TrbL component